MYDLNDSHSPGKSHVVALYTCTMSTYWFPSLNRILLDVEIVTKQKTEENEDFTVAEVPTLSRYTNQTSGALH